MYNLSRCRPQLNSLDYSQVFNDTEIILISDVTAAGSRRYKKTMEV